MPPPPPPPLPIVGTIPIDMAAQRIALYHNDLPTGSIKSFVLYVDEFLNLASMISSMNNLTSGFDINGVRIYFGLIEFDEFNDELCLIMVPVSGFYPKDGFAGTDLIQQFIYTADNEQPLQLVSFCYGVTRSCPANPYICAAANQGLPALPTGSDPYYSNIPPSAEVPDVSSTARTVGTFNIETANMYVSAYQKRYPGKTKSFTMKANEFLNMANAISSMNTLTNGFEINAARIYIGKKNENDLCLILVPVSAFDPDNTDDDLKPGADLVQQFIYGPAVDALSLVSFCYDFTYPCPSTCHTKINGLPGLPSDNAVYYPGILEMFNKKK